jgi:hypothetical protein
MNLIIALQPKMMMLTSLVVKFLDVQNAFSVEKE